MLVPAPTFAAPPESPPGPAIELEANVETDRAIEQRLRAIYAELGELSSIEVTSVAGVIHLSGSARSLEAVQQAEDLAARVEGVVAVTSDIQQEAQISRRLEPVFERMGERVAGWWSYLPLVVVALAAVALAWFLARLLTRKIRREREPDTFGRQIIGQLVRGGILAIGIVIALEVLGARGLLGAMIGTAGVIGIVLGIAFKNIGEAYIASVLLSMRRPFDPYDFVRIDDDEGSVVRLTSRATLLMTADGNHVSIPNSKVFGATVVNFTRNPQRRFSFKLGVGVDAELRRVQELAVETIAAVPGVLSEPGPSCLIESFADSEIVVSIAGWINQRESDFLKVSSEAKRLIKAAFDEAGIDMPEPILRVRTTTFEPRAKTFEPRAEPSADVSPDDQLDRQVAEARNSGPQDDLLRKGGRME